MDPTLHEFISGVPKIEMHLHIEGTLTPSLRLALAKRNNISINHTTEEDMKASYNFTDLSTFLNVYYSGMDVLLNTKDFYDLTYDYLSKAKTQNLVYVEIFFDPQAHTSRGVSFEFVITGIRNAMEDGEKNLGIKSNLIMCFLRDHSAESAHATLLESLPYKKWIVGVGLDSDEKNNPPEKFQGVFKRAREEGFKLTMHCDVNQHNTHEHILQCVNLIKVDRIDHGLNVADSPDLIDLIKKAGLGLTICPVSNEYVDKFGESKIKALLEAGVKVTINSDDPAYMGEKYILENIAEVTTRCGWGKEEVIQIQQNAIEISWLNDQEKEELRENLRKYVVQHHN